MSDRIGQWATTPRSTRWHLIESEVGRTVVTRCGRQLQKPEVQPIRTHDTSLRLCFYCGYNDEFLRSQHEVAFNNRSQWR